jgi:hypothetical protein
VFWHGLHIWIEKERRRVLFSDIILDNTQEAEEAYFWCLFFQKAKSWYNFWYGNGLFPLPLLLDRFSEEAKDLIVFL